MRRTPSLWELRNNALLCYLWGCETHTRHSFYKSAAYFRTLADGLFDFGCVEGLDAEGARLPLA